MIDPPLWKPDEARVRNARMTEFLQFVRERHAIDVSDYASLWQWSIDRRERFWPAVWDFAGVVSSRRRDDVLVDGDAMPGANWFAGARLNFAENLLRFRDDRPAIVFWNERGRQRALTYAELFDEVARIAAWLRRNGIGVGDRVAAYLPNMPETVVAMLAAASVGAAFSSCSPDFGAEGVVDRFGQIEPAVLFAADGYLYAGKSHDCLERVERIRERIPSIRHVVVVSYSDNCRGRAPCRPAVVQSNQLSGSVGSESDSQATRPAAGPPQDAVPTPGGRHGGTAPTDASVTWDSIPQAGDLQFEQMPFDHPLYILFSSGTTGVPKCIVHGAGGTLLQHLKEHQLHTDVTRDDRLFYFTTCGWMMWNWLASGLASGCTLVLYDGSPFHPHPGHLFDMADAEAVTIFGTSAKYLSAVEKAGLKPRQTHSLQSLKTILSTGSPLAPESFDFVYAQIKTDVCLSSISGGTDIVSCFVLGNPIGPVWRGEIQCAGLGMAVDVFDEDGNPVVGQKGELVCTKPFPSMPVGFWNDPDGERYREAYFARFPNAWHHGDYAEKTSHGGYIIHGRSDAVLNPGGVRIGTAEIYRQVEKLPEVLESIVIGQEWQDDTRIVLFVRLREGIELDEELKEAIARQIRRGASPRHVPAKIIAVPDIPRTKSGKIVELAVREVVHGRDAKNRHALANPEALEHFANRPELAT